MDLARQISIITFIEMKKSFFFCSQALFIYLRIFMYLSVFYALIWKAIYFSFRRSNYFREKIDN